MLFPRPCILFVLQQLQPISDQLTRPRWLNNPIYIASLCCDKRTLESIFIFFDLGSYILASSEYNFYSSLGSHDCYFCSRPCIIQISFQLFRTHHTISTSICLPSNKSNFRNCAFSIGIEKLSSMTNDAIMLLRSTWEEARHINKCNHRDIEGITKSDETGSFDWGIYIQASC